MYDYEESVKQDVVEYIRENTDYIKASDKDELREELSDILWASDSVTGNASGSYTFNVYEAEKNLNGNWGLLSEALEEFGYEEINPVKKGAEWCDVIIRCYLLDFCIAKAIDEIDEETLNEIFITNESE